MKRRLRFAGHLARHDDQPVNHLLFWEPSYGKRYHGRPRNTYPGLLLEDNGLERTQRDQYPRLRLAMQNREEWRAEVERLVAPAAPTQDSFLSTCNLRSVRGHLASNIMFWMCKNI